MPKVDLESIEQVNRTGYPPPFDREVAGRWYRRLAPATGLTDFAASHVVLKSGSWSSQRHWHAVEDELVYVLSGTVTLVMDEGEQVLQAGDCAGFKAGVRNGHVLKNLSEDEAKLLVVGGRDDADWGEYSEIDMKFHPGRYSGRNIKTRKDGSPL